jgi:hypothetical protein
MNLIYDIISYNHIYNIISHHLIYNIISYNISYKNSTICRWIESQIPFASLEEKEPLYQDKESTMVVYSLDGDRAHVLNFGWLGLEL